VSEDPWLKDFNAAVKREKLREQERAAERAELEELRRLVRRK